MNKPTFLDNIKFVNYIVIDSKYEEFNELTPKKDGYTVLNAGNEDPIQIDSDNKEFSILSFLEYSGFQGKMDQASEKSENTNEKVFSVKIKVKLNYLFDDDKNITEKSINKYNWFFNSHASIISSLITKDILSKTKYDGIAEFLTKV